MADQKKILLAEDDEFLSTLIKNRLQREGFEVTVAKDGEEVLTILKGLKPDLVLMDIILPKKLGFEVMEQIQADPKLSRTPFMVISNLGQDSDIRKAKELGAIDYFVKARILIDDLINRIKGFLNPGVPTTETSTEAKV